MSHDDDIRRINALEELFDELRRVVTSILEWKNKISGGLTVMVWVIGVIQSVVLVCLGLAANSLNNTATILGNHAVDLAATKQKMESFMGDGPRFTYEMNQAIDDKRTAEMKQWVHEEFRKKEP